jgi:hypothetical protein
MVFPKCDDLPPGTVMIQGDGWEEVVPDCRFDLSISKLYVTVILHRDRSAPELDLQLKPMIVVLPPSAGRVFILAQAFIPPRQYEKWICVPGHLIEFSTSPGRAELLLERGSVDPYTTGEDPLAEP